MSRLQSRISNKSKKRRSWLAWIGLLPLFLFGVSFQLIPILTLLRSSLITKHGLSLEYYQRAFTPVIIDSFVNSLKLSGATALLGVILGPIVALAIISSPNKFVRDGSDCPLGRDHQLRRRAAGLRLHHHARLDRRHHLDPEGGGGQPVS